MNKNVIALDSPAFKSLIQQSASLRGRRDFQSAIALIEAELDNLHPDCFENAYLEIIWAAKEGHEHSVAVKYARLLEAIDPDIPVVKQVLREVDPVAAHHCCAAKPPGRSGDRAGDAICCLKYQSPRASSSKPPTLRTHGLPAGLLQFTH